MEALGISHWEKSLPNLLNTNWHKFTQSMSEAVGNVIFLNVENATSFMT